ncbi:MAG: ABC transporter permease [Candidatus Syntrophonatronum acetioxidans]|uniref:ABC transporter permease n=1 Tax=Candidatus Syntrophonatronum acetioxidans TaxID=1795816 RepID=A0A424YHI0_9FIRM|nr:MAG: ABC transporter permease [Candidatus Syntrophonatronum acetioxidans]
MNIIQQKIFRKQVAKFVDYKIEKYFSQILLSILLLAIIVGLSSVSPFFLTWNNFRNILDHTSLHIVLALGMTFVICTGGIDLSIGSVSALSGVCMAVAMHAGLPVPQSIFIGIVAGMLIGLVNGTIISLLEINPFIITLGMMSVSRGLALIITGGIPIYGFGRSFTWWGSGYIGPLNPPILIAGILTIVSAIVLNMSKMGYYTLALGGNEEALRRSGVKTNFYKILVYVFCSLTAALGGFIVTARLNTAEPLAGWMFELDAIAAVVLGGTTMKGGKGSIFGTVLACMLLGVLRNGLTIMSIPSYYQQLLIGLIILTSVILSERRSTD